MIFCSKRIRNKYCRLFSPHIIQQPSSLRPLPPLHLLLHKHIPSWSIKAFVQILFLLLFCLAALAAKILPGLPDQLQVIFFKNIYIFFNRFINTFCSKASTHYKNCFHFRLQSKKFQRFFFIYFFKKIFRTGFPVTIIFFAGKYFSIPSEATKIFCRSFSQHDIAFAGQRIAFMNERWNSFRLRKPQNRKSRISSYPDHCIRFKGFKNLLTCKKLLTNLRQPNIFNQRTSVITCYIQTLIL